MIFENCPRCRGERFVKSPVEGQDPIPCPTCQGEGGLRFLPSGERIPAPSFDRLTKFDGLNEEGVYVRRIINGTAEDGFWMAYSRIGKALCSRRLRKDAFEKGMEIAHSQRMAVNGRNH
jgi:hypothetical protein